jgi:predicted nucleic acid-binding protein
MTALVFVDTNVVVYRFDSTEPDKQSRTQLWFDRLWAARAGRVSTQVLHESYATLTRKLSMPKAEARQIVQALQAWDPVMLDEGVLNGAFHLEDRWSLAWWDSLIVAAAFASGAPYLLSEDLQSGQDFEGVRVIDPFSVSPDAVVPVPDRNQEP